MNEQWKTMNSGENEATAICTREDDTPSSILTQLRPERKPFMNHVHNCITAGGGVRARNNIVAGTRIEDDHEIESPTRYPVASIDSTRAVHFWAEWVENERQKSPRWRLSEIRPATLEDAGGLHSPPPSCDATRRWNVIAKPD